MQIEELLRESRKLYENGGKVFDIYSLLSDSSGGKYPLAKYGSIIDCNSFPKDMSPVEKRKLRKEGNKQYELRTEEIEGLIGNIENLIKEQYPKVVIERCNTFLYSKDTLVMENKDFFLTFYYAPYQPEKEYTTSEIKLYFNMPVEKTEEFFKEYSNFVVENNMVSLFKTRYENATDMVTVRINDVEKLDEVVGIISKYRNFDKINPLVDTYDGIGYTLDNGESYNDLLSKLIYDYVSENEIVDKESFIKYLEDFKNNAKMPKFSSRKEDIQYIHSLNFTNLIENKEFDLEVFKNKYKELLELEIKTSEEERFIDRYTIEIRNSLKEIGLADMEKMYNAIDAIVNDDEKTVEFNEKSYRIIDILSSYFESDNIKEKLTEYVESDIEYDRELSINKMKRDIEEYASDIVVELAKIGFDSDEQLMQGINSVVNNDKTIHTINGKNIKLNDLIKYCMSDYIDSENTTEILYDITNDMISFTNNLVEYINSKDKITRSLLYKVDEKVEEFENENEDEPISSLRIYDMTEKLLAYKYGVDEGSLNSILRVIAEKTNKENEKGTTKIKQQQ